MKTKQPDNEKTTPTIKTLPGDDIRQIMWRFQDRYELQMAVQSARSVARGIVARLVAEGQRKSHEWTKEKNEILEAFDASGVTAAFMEPHQGGYIEGPKNLALALIAFELAWVDAGAATATMAGNLALAPIYEKGTQEQKDLYMKRCAPGHSDDGKVWRGSFVLTEPLPYVGVDTGVLGGKVRVSQWDKDKNPVLQVEKRGRFITNMGYANFVTAAVESDDEKIKGTCMVILEQGDPGIYDPGTPTLKLVHQLSSTSDPVFNLKIPADRIIGGYTVQDGVIIPNFSHSEVIEAVFRRTRVTAAIMTSAKLLSAIEPIIRYQRGRFRGGDSGAPGTPRYELGLQMKEDVLHRLIDIWATGEASTSLGFATARLFDEYDPYEKAKDELFQEQEIKGMRAKMKVLKAAQKKAIEYISLSKKKRTDEEEAKFKELEGDRLTQFIIKDSLTNVFCPASKLWNTGHGVNTMREAVSLMGGYGITEDCPGFLAYKWMDGQLEATYEGPEAVQRRQLSVTMTDEVFLAQFRNWIYELRRIAEVRPGTGACTLASAMELWLWSLQHLLKAKDSEGKALYHGQRQGVTFPMADALSWLLASRAQIMDTIELEIKGPENSTLGEDLEGYTQFFRDLCHVQAARSAGEVSRICSELVFGYNAHPCWNESERTYKAEDLDGMECLMPGISGCARSVSDVVESDGSHAFKAGPCVCFEGLEAFIQLRKKLDGCLTGSRIAKDRASQSATQIMIPEALDYPM